MGILTEDLITRGLYYEHALILTLIPFIHPELYPMYRVCCKRVLYDFQKRGLFLSSSSFRNISRARENNGRRV